MQRDGEAVCACLAISAQHLDRALSMHGPARARESVTNPAKERSKVAHASRTMPLLHLFAGSCHLIFARSRPVPFFSIVSLALFTDRRYGMPEGIKATVPKAPRDCARVQVVPVPPNRPCQRLDYALELYESKEHAEGRIKAIIRAVLRSGQPILIGTDSTADSNRVYELAQRARDDCAQEEKEKLEALQLDSGANMEPSCILAKPRSLFCHQLCSNNLCCSYAAGDACPRHAPQAYCTACCLTPNWQAPGAHYTAVDVQCAVQTIFHMAASPSSACMPLRPPTSSFSTRTPNELHKSR